MRWPRVTWLLTVFTVFREASSQTLQEMKAYLMRQYMDSITAYGPGVGVFTPYLYADISYNNIPFIGKIPSLGKEGTSSRLGISPFYPEGGNPSVPYPRLYRANPLPPHVPEPVDVVAVPLDEEALHGEPLFPKELTLPTEMEYAGKPEEEKPKPPVKEPFGREEPAGKVFWPDEPEGAEETKEESLVAEEKENMLKGSDKTPPPNPFIWR